MCVEVFFLPCDRQDLVLYRKPTHRMKSFLFISQNAPPPVHQLVCVEVFLFIYLSNVTWSLFLTSTHSDWWMTLMDTKRKRHRSKKRRCPQTSQKFVQFFLCKKGRLNGFGILDCFPYKKHIMPSDVMEDGRQNVWSLRLVLITDHYNFEKILLFFEMTYQSGELYFKNATSSYRLRY